MISATLKCGKSVYEGNGDMTVAVLDNGMTSFVFHTGRDGCVYLDPAACEVLRALMTVATQLGNAHG